MYELGTLAAYSAYTSFATSVYKTNQTSLVKDKQESSAENIKTAPNDEINDEAIISDEAKALLASEESSSQEEKSDKDKMDSSKEDKEDIASQLKELTPDEKQAIAKLQARDTEVKAHEQAHRSAASGLNASAPSYDYQTGPDGKKYAVGGEVNISFTESANPEENIAKAAAMKKAALAPVQPSSQDLSVARSADRLIIEAEQELKKESSPTGDNKDKTGTETGAIADSTEKSDQMQKYKQFSK